MNNSAQALATMNPLKTGSNRFWAGAIGMLPGLLSAAMLILSFPPFGLWPLALFALAPLSYGILRQPLTRKWIVWYWLLGFLYFSGGLFWLIPVTVPGYLALCAYLAVYFPIFAALLRLLSNRFRLPAILGVPVTFTAVEYVRSVLFTGFPWFMLGTALAPATHFLQLADLAGVSGLTFLAAIGSGWLTDMAMRHTDDKPVFTRRVVETLACVGVFATAWTYGSFRLHQKAFRPGPTVAVIQKYIPQSIKDSSGIAGDKKLFNGFMKLTAQAAKFHPDLIAWPETMVPGFLNRQWLVLSPYVFKAGYTRRLLTLDQGFARELKDFSHRTGASLLVGSSSVRFNARGRVRQMQNISVLFTPKRGQIRPPYAKHHLVPFGEYVPFKHSAPWLHHWLLYLTPFGPKDDYSLTPGRRWRRFRLTVGSHSWRFGTPICYEDAMGHPSRMFARPRHGRKGVAFLVSISNDGWYRDRAELEQHLQLDQVRAVEERVPIARSVNGGDSGFIDSDGRVRKLVTKNGHSAFVSGFAVARLPLDDRISLFSRTGDVFARLLVLLNLLALLAGGAAVMFRTSLKRWSWPRSLGRRVLKRKEKHGRP
ncbi:MAG: apolipoprotein N-acyltransferase [Planctomycetes bacterium]|jgi:apolipoprotein N-acyltransferase|nr:apolipoprotein N-acyltransferase [Planctomycetota bacterium]